MPNRTNRTKPANRQRCVGPALLLPAVVLALAACAGAAAPPSATPSSAPIATERPSPTPVPGDPGSGGGTGGGTDPGSGGGGGAGGNTGGGIIFPIPGGGDPNLDALFGDANYGTPAADLVNQHPVNVQLVRAIQEEDGTVVADLRWYSGVAPESTRQSSRRKTAPRRSIRRRSMRP